MPEIEAFGIRNRGSSIQFGGEKSFGLQINQQSKEIQKKEITIIFGDERKVSSEFDYANNPIPFGTPDIRKTNN